MTINKKIQALLPKNKSGHQFVIYADSCSGIPGREHEKNLSSINSVFKRIDPKPEFICFPGDEISGLVNNEEELLKQWDYWLNYEMAWLKEFNIPFYNTTGNHTAYNLISEKIFRQTFSYLPRNGPKGQKGLAYYIQKDNLLLIFVNTMWSGLGGEGRVETEWLEKVLSDNFHIKNKLVFGHHPIHSVNGYTGDFQRNIEAENGKRFWNILKKYGVNAYICSHILAFDVQVHEGILQILTAGAGTPYRMPESEYLHLIQFAIDNNGFQYQVLDRNGDKREWLKWPIEIPGSKNWLEITDDCDSIKYNDSEATEIQTLLIYEFSGKLNSSKVSYSQTLISGWGLINELPIIWIGLTGKEQRLTVYISPEIGRSPHQWYGPTLSSMSEFNIQIGLHNGMGPGGFIWRWNSESPWSSLTGASPWGAERLKALKFWSPGTSKLCKENNLSFLGENLKVKYTIEEINF